MLVWGTQLPFPLRYAQVFLCVMVPVVSFFPGIPKSWGVNWQKSGQPYVWVLALNPLFPPQENHWMYVQILSFGKRRNSGISNTHYSNREWFLPSNSCWVNQRGNLWLKNGDSLKADRVVRASLTTNECWAWKFMGGPPPQQPLLKGAYFICFVLTHMQKRERGEKNPGCCSPWSTWRKSRKGGGGVCETLIIMKYW